MNKSGDTLNLAQNRAGHFSNCNQREGNKNGPKKTQKNTENNFHCLHLHLLALSLSLSLIPDINAIYRSLYVFYNI